MNRGASHIFLKALLFLSMVGFICGNALPALAQGSIAMVSDFSGTVLVFSGEDITKLSRTQGPINNMDMVLTQSGTAKITFGDGAVLDLTSHSLVMVQEGMEKHGKLVGKKKPVRRITTYVGKIRFKSGSSSIQNCLQTPTAVCVLSGSEAQLCNDNVTSYLQILSGQATTMGSFVRSYCESPGVSAAQKNELYQQLLAAWETYQTDPSQGKLMALMALESAATLLLSSPDPVVVGVARQALEQVKNEMETLREELQRELDGLRETGQPDASVEREIDELEQAIQRLEADLGELPEDVVVDWGITTTTTTTTSTTTVAPTSPKQ